MANKNLKNYLFNNNYEAGITASKNFEAAKQLEALEKGKKFVKQPTFHEFYLELFNSLHKNFGGTVRPRCVIQSFIENYCFNKPSYNTNSKKYNYDTNDSSNAKRQAGAAMSVLITTSIASEIK